MCVWVGINKSTADLHTHTHTCIHYLTWKQEWEQVREWVCGRVQGTRQSVMSCAIGSVYNCNILVNKRVQETHTLSTTDAEARIFLLPSPRPWHLQRLHPFRSCHAHSAGGLWFINAFWAPAYYNLGMRSNLGGLYHITMLLPTYGFARGWTRAIKRSAHVAHITS